MSNPHKKKIEMFVKGIKIKSSASNIYKEKVWRKLYKIYLKEFQSTKRLKHLLDTTFADFLHGKTFYIVGMGFGASLSPVTYKTLGRNIASADAFMNADNNTFYFIDCCVQVIEFNEKCNDPHALSSDAMEPFLPPLYSLNEEVGLLAETLRGVLTFKSVGSESLFSGTVEIEPSEAVGISDVMLEVSQFTRGRVREIMLKDVWRGKAFYHQANLGSAASLHTRQFCAVLKHTKNQMTGMLKVEQIARISDEPKRGNLHLTTHELEVECCFSSLRASND